MPTKVFTTIDGGCPFGRGIEIDSTGCRKCQYYYRSGTGMFFWCNHPIEPIKRKRGRPPGKANLKPNKTHKKKNG